MNENDNDRDPTLKTFRNYYFERLPFAQRFPAESCPYFTIIILSLRLDVDLFKYLIWNRNQAVDSKLELSWVSGLCRIETRLIKSIVASPVDEAPREKSS